MSKQLEAIPQGIKDEAIRIASSPERIWSNVFINYDTDFSEWFVNPFGCDPAEDGAVTIAKVDESTKTVVVANLPSDWPHVADRSY